MAEIKAIKIERKVALTVGHLQHHHSGTGSPQAITPITHIKSFVGRNSRMTTSQSQALDQLMTVYGRTIDDGLIDCDAWFKRSAPVFLEIGFGSGQSLLALAKAYPEHNFIGIETHLPGIGALLLGIARLGLSNLRVIRGDAYDCLQRCFANDALAGVQIFFPDPWPKRRHHARRFIQPAVIGFIAEKLIPLGLLHIATDWQDYARHISLAMSASPNFRLAAQQTTRSWLRPMITKFEARALREGRSIWDAQYLKP